VQSCREALQLIPQQKIEFLQGGEELKGLLLLLCQALHLAADAEIQFGEGGIEEAADRRSKESGLAMRTQLEELGGTGKYLYIQRP
jgi:hypothetical protein